MAVVASVILLSGLAPRPGLSLGAGPTFDPARLPPGACAGRIPYLFPNGALLCSHGPDPAPDGVDATVPWRPDPVHPRGLILPDPPTGPPSYAAGNAGIACVGNGTDGPRVQAVYAVPADRPDRFGQVENSIRSWAAQTDTVFRSSAAKTGGERRIRFVTDYCELQIMRVSLSARGDDTFDNTLAEFQAKGLNRSDRKYLVWMESTALCGIGSYYVDDSPGPTNANNGRAGVPGSVARIDSGCWGLGSSGQSVEAHELLHTLGGVQPSAPRGSANGHCSDDADRMCYQDGSVAALVDRCPSEEEQLFDCGNDDYFSAAPAPSGYISTHWNTASSAFLVETATTPTVTVADASVTEGDSGTVEMRFTVSLSRAPIETVTMRYATADGSALASTDYEARSGKVFFQPGVSVSGVTVRVRGDVVPENDERFTVTLSDLVNVAPGRTQATGSILDDEPRLQGYWFVAADGGIFSFGQGRFHGSTGAIRLNQPVVGMARTPSGRGYWLVARDGGIFSFGDAEFFGSTGAIRLNQPIVGMAATPTGRGYWFVAADGGIFAFGDAPFFGSAGGRSIPQPIVGMAATPSGGGYWFAGADGRVYEFGDARNHGTPGGISAPVVGIAPTPTGAGYWLASRDGRVHRFGDALELGSTGALNHPVTGISATSDGQGYWLVARDGGIFSFGDARFQGSTGAITLNQPIVGMAAAPR